MQKVLVDILPSKIFVFRPLIEGDSHLKLTVSKVVEPAKE